MKDEQSLYILEKGCLNDVLDFLNDGLESQKILRQIKVIIKKIYK